MLEISTLGWIVTIAVIVGLLALDLILAAAKPHAVGFKEAIAWSVFYIAVAIVVRPRLLVLRRQRLRHPVLRRLHRREEPVGRQPVRLRDHHDHVRGARAAPAQGADLRHHHRADPAGDLHRAGRRAAGAVRGDVPAVRHAADLHGDPAVPAPRPGPGHPGQHVRQADPQGDSGDRRVPRRQPVHPDRRQDGSPPRCSSC